MLYLTYIEKPYLRRIQGLTLCDLFRGSHKGLYLRYMAEPGGVRGARPRKIDVKMN